MDDDPHPAAPPAAPDAACPEPILPPEPAKPKKRKRGRSRRQRLRLLREQMLAEQGHQCPFCGCEMLSGPWPYRPNSATLDHIVPRACGGTDIPENLRLACMRCNSTRHHQLADPVSHARALAAIAAEKARQRR